MGHIPLNTSAVTDKIRRGLTGNPARVETAAQGLAAALAGNTPQPETEHPEPTSTVDGTGFGLSPSHKVPAVDPSQGRTGRAKPIDNRDPLLVAFQHVLNF